MLMNDGLSNLVSGLGTPRDKAVAAVYGVRELTDAELSTAYRAAPLAKKIVNVPARDAVREWREWQAEADQVTLIEAEETRLGLLAKLAKAKMVARLRGGGALLIGTGDQDLAKPIRIEGIRKGGLKYLAPLSRRSLIPGDIERDPNAPGFGQPKDFTLMGANGVMLHIHPSRLVIFRGEETLDDEYLTGANWWGDSVLQSTLDSVRDTDATFGNILSLIYEAKIDVVKIPDFTQNLSTGGSKYERQMIARWQLAMAGKGINGAMMMDAKEEWEQKTANFSGLDKLTDKFMIRVAAAADMPVTRLWGEAAAGLNSTGEGDLRNYYDGVKTHQTLDIDPAMSVLNEVLIRSALGDRPSEIHYNWRPLWQPTARDKAEVADKVTSAFERVHRMDVVPSEALGNAVVNALTESGVAPGLEADVKTFFGGEGDDLDGPHVVADAAPRTLYVSRKVKNAGDIIAWAKEQGFKVTLPADDLHVTVAFSRRPVDWLKMGSDWHGELTVNEGGARLMESFGDARVLVFASDALRWRHEDMRREGASWDHPDYNPHITISYSDDSPDLKDVEPYQGEIILGPEIFQEIKEDWHEGIQEA